MALNIPFSDISVATQTILDALAVPTVVIERSGVITIVNEAWRNFCQDDAAGADGFINQNYLDVCGPLQRLDKAGVCQRGIKAVLSGALPGFHFDYKRETRSGIRSLHVYRRAAERRDRWRGYKSRRHNRESSGRYEIQTPARSAD